MSQFDEIETTSFGRARHCCVVAAARGMRRRECINTYINSESTARYFVKVSYEQQMVTLSILTKWTHSSHVLRNDS